MLKELERRSWIAKTNVLNSLYMLFEHLSTSALVDAGNSGGSRTRYICFARVDMGQKCDFVGPFQFAWFLVYQVKSIKYTYT
jgi:hypothetical protein